ncbi:MAG: methyltransferase [Bacteroidota bacterium]
MGKPYFRFKEFAIRQDRCAMKVGTDGILLGAWAKVNAAKRILDIGTGTGLLSLMVAQRNAQAHIVGIEIDPAAAQQAQENVSQSPWCDRIEIRAEAIQQHRGTYEAILCNPPFFRNGQTRNSPSVAQARHTTALSHQSLIHAVKRSLAPRGQFSLLLPVPEAESFLSLAEDHGLFPSLLTVVHSRPQHAPFRYLMSLCHEKTPLRRRRLLLHEATGSVPHADFLKLAQAFYLHW